jgi:hypothetical protein
MYSGPDTLERVGFPIRTSADQRSLASPRGFSQRATSFIASWRQGIHRTPLSRSISHHHRPHAGPNRAPHDKRNAIPIAQPIQFTLSLRLPTNPSSLVKEHPPGRHPKRTSRQTAVYWKRASRQWTRRTTPRHRRRPARPILAQCIPALSRRIPVPVQHSHRLWRQPDSNR